MDNSAQKQQEESHVKSQLLAVSARGTALNTIAAGGGACLSIVSQFVLASFLTPGDFGVYAIAFSYGQLFRVLMDGGVGRWLARCDEQTFRKELPDACSLLLLSAGLVVISLLVIGPLLAEVYGHGDIASLMALFAFTCIFEAYSIVGRARLLVGLKFGTYAFMNGSAYVVHYVVMVCFAWWGWGPYCFLLGLTASSGYELMFHVFVSRVPIEVRKISFAGARRIWRKCHWSLWGNSVGVVKAQVDYAILGLFLPSATLGAYYFAYQLVQRPAALVGETMRRAALPIFARVPPGSGQEHRGLGYASALLGLGATPLLFLLSVVAPQAMSFLWGERWSASIVPVQILAVAMPAHLLGLFARPFAEARGRFRFWAGVASLDALLFVSALLAAIWLVPERDLVGITTVIAAYLAASGVLQLWTTLRTLEIRPRRFFSTWVLGFSLGLLALVGTFLAQRIVADLGFRLFFSIVFFCGLAAVLYVSLARTGSAELARLVKQVVRRNTSGAG